VSCKRTWRAWPGLLHLLLHDLAQLQQPAEVQLRVLPVKAALLAKQEALALQQQQEESLAKQEQQAPVASCLHASDRHHKPHVISQRYADTII
jgi:hypothetical protein